jgi:hypothetical protein
MRVSRFIIVGQNEYLFACKVWRKFRLEVSGPATVCGGSKPQPHKRDAIGFAFRYPNLLRFNYGRQVEWNRLNAVQIVNKSALAIRSSLGKGFRIAMANDLIQQLSCGVGVAINRRNRPAGRIPPRPVSLWPAVVVVRLLRPSDHSEHCVCGLSEVQTAKFHFERYDVKSFPATAVAKRSPGFTVNHKVRVFPLMDWAGPSHFPLYHPQARHSLAIVVQDFARRKIDHLRASGAMDSGGLFTVTQDQSGTLVRQPHQAAARVPPPPGCAATYE